MTTRTMCRFAAAVILSAFPLTSEAGFGAWTTGGPLGGWVRSIVFDPKTPGVIYAGTSGGVFVTRNGGQSWQRINTGLEVTSVVALDLDPTNPSDLGVVVQPLYSQPAIGGVFTSNNGGATWHQSTAGMTDLRGSSIAYDPLNSGVAYAGTYNGIFRTANGGNSWVGINSGLTSTFITSIAVDPMIPGRLYVGSAGISATDNSGASWYPSGNGMPAAVGVQVIVIDRLNPLTLYSAANFSPVNLYQSVDRAGSWNPFNFGLPPSGFGAIFHIAAEPSGLFAAILGRGIYQYNTSPPTPQWYANNLGLSAPFNCLTVAVDPFHPSLVYASDDGVLTNSTLLGLTWQPTNSGLTAHPINTVAIDPTNTQTVYAGTQDRGAYVSHDGGITWSQINTGFNMVVPFVFSIVIDPTNPSLLYAGAADDIYKSSNYGQSWTASSTGLFTGFADYVYALAIDPSNSSVLWAGRSDAIYKSTNSATSWTSMTGGPAYSLGGFRSLAIDRQNPSIVYAGTGLGDVYKTVNGGTTWTTISGNLPTIRSVAAIAIDPTDSSNVYVGMEANVNLGPGGVFVTHNSGATWTKLAVGMTTLDVASLLFDPNNPATLLAGTRGGGVFISPNRGLNWFPFNSGAPNQFVSSLAMGTVTPFPILPFLKFRRLYAGTEGSVYNITY